MTRQTAALAVKGLVKWYGSVTALAGIDFEIYPGEIAAIVGDNGAGKSTFVKILNGVAMPDEGSIFLRGELVEFRSPADAMKLGIETVYQDLALAGDLSAAQNIFMGREVMKPGLLGRMGVLDKRQMRKQSTDLLERLEIALPRDSVPVCDLSGGQRQCVAIARAVAWAHHVLILDEPTAALGVAQQKVVLSLLKRIKRDHQIPIILVSHNMRDVFEVADRIIVFRRGQSVATFRTSECTLNQVVGAITGSNDLLSNGGGTRR
ncbi:MAG: ATP-binding cassette domain-containing protein [Nitrospirota bacterium]|nr:ATP-binding cassette domain-containing protein [Nitrospirota bacterium]